MTKEYDLIFSIGEDCACASYLQQCGLRKSSGPFDWLTKASFKTRIDMIVNDFSGFLEKDNMRKLSKDSTKSTDPLHDYYEDIQTDFYFYHDFPATLPFETSFEEIKKKYNRRIDRFYQTISFVQNVLFIWFSREKTIGNEDVIDAYNSLAKKFPNQKIHLLILQNGQNRAEQLSENIIIKQYENASFVRIEDEWLGNFKVNKKTFNQLKISNKKYISDADIEEHVQKNKKKFDNILKDSDIETDENKKILLLKEAATFATYNSCGILTSSKIENDLCKIAQRHHIDLPDTYEPNSVLHVASNIYIAGGHSTVLDRWIRNKPQNQKNSLAITWRMPHEHVLKSTSDAVMSSGGDVYFLSENCNSPLEIALKLRLLASRYEKIVLHIHMEDVIPILAFGTTDFKRPIVLFNHSDHIFWLGVSIADQVASFRNFAKELCISKRQITSNTSIPLPIEDNAFIQEKEKNCLRYKLKIPKESKVIVTMARAIKFLPFNQYDFVNVVEKVLTKTKNSYFLIIGPDEKDIVWKKLPQNLKKRVRLLGELPVTDILKYISLADIALDSFPFSSTLSFYELAKQNIPAFTLQTPINHDDLNDATNTTCSNQKELIECVVAALNTQKKEETKAYIFLKENNFPLAFSKHLKKLYSNFPKIHHINKMPEKDNSTLTPIERFTALNYLVQQEATDYLFSKRNKKISYLTKFYCFVFKCLIAIYPNKKIRKTLRSHFNLNKTKVK